MTTTRRIPKEQSDSFLKGVFSHRYVLAHLLKTFVAERKEGAKTIFKKPYITI